MRSPLPRSPPPAFGHGLLRGWLQLWPGLSLQHAQSWAGVRPWERLPLWQAHGGLINKSVQAPQVACCCPGGRGETPISPVLPGPPLAP